MTNHPHIIAAIAVLWPAVLSVGASVDDEPMAACLLFIVAILTAVVAWPV